MRFDANVSLLFAEVPFPERFGRAAEAGFSAVEFWWPGEDLGRVEGAVREAGLDVALLGFDAGDMAGGDRGLASDPAREGRFRENVPVALELARAVGCERVNVLLGHERPGMDREEQLALARRNVRFAADMAREAGVTVLVEAVNTIENGSYLISTTREAVAFAREVGEGVAVQHDLYHMQRMEGNLAATLRENIGLIRHVQVADSPGRGEPGSGEVNYRYVLGVLEELGYDGYVGLEYRPSAGSTGESLAWLPRELRGGGARVADLRL